MLNHSLVINLVVPGVVDQAASQLRLEYQSYQHLLQAQPASVQRQLEAQAAILAAALDQRASHIRYNLPDAVYQPAQDRHTSLARLPARMRRQSIGGWFDRLVHHDTQSALLEQLFEFGKSSESPVSTATHLLRHALAVYTVHTYLPDGQKVQYRAEQDDEIPCVPVGAARLGFYLPQWVVVDDQQHLLVASFAEAMAIFEDMQRYLSMLDTAARLASYIVVDDEYQRKHYGILGQFVNQGRALASYQVAQICETIKRRAAAHDLDRGFSLSLPYFNDKTLAMELYDFDVVPCGRVMFVPAFLVLAVRAEGAKVIQDTRFNRTTRINLVKELYTIERTFLE